MAAWNYLLFKFFNFLHQSCFVSFPSVKRNMNKKNEQKNDASDNHEDNIDDDIVNDHRDM